MTKVYKTKDACGGVRSWREATAEEWDHASDFAREILLIPEASDSSPAAVVDPIAGTINGRVRMIFVVEVR